MLAHLSAERAFVRLVSVKEAAGYLNMAPCTVRRMIARGELRASRVGPRQLRIDPADLSALMNGNTR